MRKILNTALFVLLAYILPLLGRPELLLHTKALLLMAGAAILFLTQPTLKLEEAREERNRDRNTVLLILLLSLVSAAAPVLDWAYWHPQRHHPSAVLIGLGLMAGGIGLRIWSILALGALFTPTVQIRKEHQLIQTGPYRWVRHPSYLGAFLALLGGAVLLESWIGIAICLCLMSIAYYIRITLEEKALVEAFGEKYMQYQEQTFRLVPFFW